MSERPEIKGMSGRLVKWDGEAPAEAAALAHPEAHPQCVEVIEFADGRPARVVFQRDTAGVNNGTD